MIWAEFHDDLDNIIAREVLWKNGRGSSFFCPGIVQSSLRLYSDLRRLSLLRVLNSPTTSRFSLMLFRRHICLLQKRWRKPSFRSALRLFRTGLLVMRLAISVTSDIKVDSGRHEKELLIIAFSASRRISMAISERFQALYAISMQTRQLLNISQLKASIKNLKLNFTFY